MDVFGHRSSGKFEEGRGIVDVLHHFRDLSPAVKAFRQAHDKRSTHGLFVHETFVKPTMLTHVEALIGSINYQCIVQ